MSKFARERRRRPVSRAGFFPDRQIYIRSARGIRFVTVPSWVQRTAATGFLIVAIAGAWSTADYLGARRSLAIYEAELERVESFRAKMEDAADLDGLERERERLLADIGVLRQQLETLRIDQHDAVAKMIERTQANIDAITAAITRIGIDPDELMEADDRGDELGGPFLDLRDYQKTGPILAAASVLGGQIGRLQDMKRMLHALPVGAPLESYRVVSGFGTRRDPINKRRAVHLGIDLAAPMRTPVLATAGGVVAYAGRHGEFGNFVEIDHGFGLRTRYGHLSRIHVKPGQTVTAETRVGLLGSTGRSTGPHVHYEILFDGKQLDPISFMEAKRHVLPD